MCGCSITGSIEKTQVLLRRDDTNGIGVALSTSPTLHCNDAVAFGQDSQFDRLGDTPFQASVNVLLPIHTVEVWLGLREVEGIHTPIEMGVSRGCCISCDHDDGAHGSVL